MVDLYRKIDALVDKVEDWSRLPADPLVCVMVVTYNHEGYIAQTLDGILMQEVDFPYEIIIGEDKSTDRTREIVCEFQRRYPDKIRLQLSRENLFSQKLAGIGILHACRGKYLAQCEGDDYWTDPLKMQKQVDFLEMHPECSACYTNAAVVNENGSPNPSIYLGAGPPAAWIVQPAEARRTQDDIFTRLAIPTCTLCYRAHYLRDLPKWANRTATGDWAMAMVLSGHGPIQYLDEITATYRRHGGGVWTSLETMMTLKHGLDRMEIFLPYAAPNQKPAMVENIRAVRADVRRHAVGALAAGLEKGREFGGDFQMRDLVRLFGLRESRRIRMVAREAYFQRAYFKKEKPLARRRALGLIGRYPEWLLRKGSLGQTLRALAGRI